MRVGTLFGFVIGVGVGIAATASYFKNKYEEIENERVDEFKKEWSDIMPKKKTVQESDHDISDPVDIPKDDPVRKNEYVRLVEEKKMRAKKVSDSEESKKVDGPIVIPPDMFGNNEDYEKLSYTYYADHVLADEYNDPIEDYEDSIGEDSLTHFGEYEEDSVFIQNDANRCYYEILLDEREYASLYPRR